MVTDGNVSKPHLRVEEREFQACVHLRTGREAYALQEHFIYRLENEGLRREVLGHRHTVLSRLYSQSVACIAIVANRSHTGQGQVSTHFNSCCSLDTHVTFVNTGHSLVNERTSLIVIVTVQLGTVPTLCEESGNTTANDRVVELIREVSRSNFLTGCIEVLQVLRLVVGVDIAYYSIVYTLRDICIACVRGTGLCQSVEFQAITTVDLIGGA